MDISQIGIAVSLISVSVAVLKLNRSNNKNGLTYNAADKKYKKIEVCDEIHKNVDEKLSCLPEIKKSVTQIETKIDMLLNNGK